MPELKKEMKHEVWRAYAGVWHMNENSGTAFDSTEHGLDALPSGGMRCDVSRMVAVDSGACGRARDNGPRITWASITALRKLSPVCFRGKVSWFIFSLSGIIHADWM